MSRYFVSLMCVCGFTVEADNEEEAIDKASDLCEYDLGGEEPCVELLEESEE